MAVTLCTGHGQAQEHTAGRIDPVHDLLDAVLLNINPPLLIGQRVTMKSRCHALLEGGVRQEVARELFDKELVVGQIPVKRFDDPLAISPRMRPHRVLLEAVAVGVTRQIQPVPRPALAKVRRRQQTVDHPLVGVWRWIVDEILDFSRRRRQTDEV